MRQVVALITVFALGMLPGCAGRQRVRAYEAELARCEANLHAIIARDPATSTEEQDLADLTAERARCLSALDTLHGDLP